MISPLDLKWNQFARNNPKEIQKPDFDSNADYQQKNLDDAALELQNVQADVLSDAQKTIYNTISQAVSSGNAGSDDTSGDGSDDSGDYDESDYYE